ncbi:MAG TPA: hypothetical protein VJ874_03985, partial [Candidatus Thermoplasmatota archaeon]|nr:hypothetical protein [Candidatus Thermoplasmatota archaeon]
TDRLVVTLANAPDREFGDLLDEPVQVSYSLLDGDNTMVGSGSVSLEPGDSVERSFNVGTLDRFTFESRAESASGASSRLSVTFTQEQCGHRSPVHLDVGYSAKLTAGSWEWGSKFETDCP